MQAMQAQMLQQQQLQAQQMQAAQAQQQQGAPYRSERTSVVSATRGRRRWSDAAKVILSCVKRTPPVVRRCQNDRLRRSESGRRRYGYPAQQF